MIFLLCLSFGLITLSDSSSSDQVFQVPAHIFKNAGEDAAIDCSHRITFYDKILWYKQTSDRQMQLLGYMNVKDGYPETGVNVLISGEATDGNKCTLTLKGVNVSSSGVYFCAASRHSAACHCCAVQKPTNKFLSSEASS